MAGPSWDPSRVKAQLRLTTQRLGQLQDKKDSSAHITSRDIATLLRQRNLALAREKAIKLIAEDASSDALQVLEMHCGVILERFADLERNDMRLHPSIVEAAASIIYSAPYIESKDLAVVRDMLSIRLGPDFARSAAYNTDGHVSRRILRALHMNPAASDVDDYLQKIARSFGVEWKPPMRPEEKTKVLSEMLDVNEYLVSVDLERLRLVTSSGLPHEPSWLRARVWKILLGFLPENKTQWEAAAEKKRTDYYDLVRQLLVSIPNLSPPSKPMLPIDKTLTKLFESLTKVPAYLYSGLGDDPEQSPLCPVHESASDDLRISFASCIDTRIQMIHDSITPSEKKTNGASPSTPEIRLQSDSAPSTPQDASFDPAQTAKKSSSSTLLAPMAFRNIAAHQYHVSALLRLLYIHKSLNPATHSPHIASLLIPLYTVMTQEADPEELAHAEADTFWLFESLLREISEMEDEEGGTVWMKRFSEQLSWIDNELYEDLKHKGLDPALPHYSYRWISPLLTHTLPLSDILMVWDTILSQPEFSRQQNPKLEHLLDICTSMLVRARVRLLLLGKSGRKSPSLWDDGPNGVPRSPLKSWELGDAFMEGMSLLQRYPLKEAGGIERILQLAEDIHQRREDRAKQPQGESVASISAKIRDTVWKGLMNSSSTETQSSAEESEGEEDLTENESTEAAKRRESNPLSPTWATRLRTTVWRGITNQSAMDVPPSPSSVSPVESRDPSPAPPSAPTSPGIAQRASSLLSPPVNPTSGLWNFTNKLSKTDVAARFSKVSTNISARALNAWTSSNTSTRSSHSDDNPQLEEEPKAMPARNYNFEKKLPEPVKENPRDNRERSSTNPLVTDTYTPPPRPAFFKPPRDSRLFSAEDMASLRLPDSPDSVQSSQSAPTSSAPKITHSRSDSLAIFQGALSSWVSPSATSTPPKSSKAAPKPLLLNASSLVTSIHPIQVTRSANSTPTPHAGQWTDVLRSRVQTVRRKDSQSSLSSLSNSVTSPKVATSGWDSDNSISRVIPLNRQSFSPLAPGFRIPRSRNPSMSSQSEFDSRLPMVTSPTETAPDSTLREQALRASEQLTTIPDSPSTLPSSPPPFTPITNVTQTSVKVSMPERQRGSIVLTETGIYQPLDSLSHHISRPLKKDPSLAGVEPVDDTSDSSRPVSPTTRLPPRIRSKHYGSRLSTIRIRDSIPSPTIVTEPRPIGSSSLLIPESDADDLAVTPKASNFPSSSPIEGKTPRRPRKLSMETQERRVRKNSQETQPIRQRKMSSETYHHRSESTADEGDDEGYDELLSAYESEEGSRDGHGWVEVHH